MSLSVNPEPGRPLTIGQLIDSENAINDTTFEALSNALERLTNRLTALEGRLDLLESLFLGQ